MLPRRIFISGAGGAGLTGPNVVGTGEVAGEEETGLATAASMLLRGISALGTGGAGLGVGIGAVLCACGGFSEGGRRTRGSSTERHRQ